MKTTVLVCSLAAVAATACLPTAHAAPLDRPSIACAAPGPLGAGRGSHVSYTDRDAAPEASLPAVPPCAAYLSTVTVAKEKPAFRT